LAGGNFYWVALDGGDAYGHNVRGISAKDAALSTAPGTIGCANTCHESLTYTDAVTGDKNGCQGCHYTVKHHGSDPAGSPVGDAGGYFRFLNVRPGHEGVGGAGVSGIEDLNWEQTPTKDNHNAYYGGTGSDADNPQSMGKFCAGCHYQFHSPGFPTSFWGIDNGGGADPWLRHPADVAIPNSGEYANYTVYSPTVPVARPDLALFTADVVRPGTDMVFCLSCHRAHGSPYPDMLRWAYSGMEPGTTGASAGTGCFKCHSDKDDV
jgi:predicted CXXCH cytochrome family protein